MTNSHLVGACTGRSPGFFAPENAINVARREPVQLNPIRPVRDQAAGEHWKGSEAHTFGQGSDIADRDGAWRWNSDRPDMHNYVRDYFVGRRQDG